MLFIIHLIQSSYQAYEVGAIIIPILQTKNPERKVKSPKATKLGDEKGGIQTEALLTTGQFVAVDEASANFSFKDHIINSSGFVGQI